MMCPSTCPLNVVSGLRGAERSPMAGILAGYLTESRGDRDNYKGNNPAASTLINSCVFTQNDIGENFYCCKLNITSLNHENPSLLHLMRSSSQRNQRRREKLQSRPFQRRRHW